MTDPCRRVKVYHLEDDEKWADKGTGQISLADHLAASPESSDDLPSRSGSRVMTIRVDSEVPPNDVLLERALRPFEHYCQQEGTLIVWTEATGEDLAISFQEAEGCADFWRVIKDACAELAQEADERQGSPFVQEPLLPDPAIKNLPWIVPAIGRLMRISFGRERLSAFIVSNSYIPKLAQLFRILEDIDAQTELSMLFHIVKNIVLLGDREIYAELVADENLFSTLGMLEYDSSCKDLPGMFRSFFKCEARYIEVLKCMPRDFHTKVTLIFRLQYLRDVVVARYLDDPVFSNLSDTIKSLYQDIFLMLLENSSFIKEILSIFKVEPPMPELQPAKSGPERLFSDKSNLTVRSSSPQPKSDAEIIDVPPSQNKSLCTENSQKRDPETVENHNHGNQNILSNEESTSRDFIEHGAETPKVECNALTADPGEPLIGPLPPTTEAAYNDGTEATALLSCHVLAKRQAAGFLKDLAGAAKQCQTLSPVEIFGGLFRSGLFSVFDSTIQDPDLETRQAVSEFLGAIVEVDRKLIRQHCIDSTLIQTLFGQLLLESDQGLLRQWVEILKRILESETTNICENDRVNEAGTVVQRALVTVEYERFLELFYRCVSSKILDPLRQVLLHKLEVRVVDSSTAQCRISVYQLPMHLVDQVYQLMELLVVMLKSNSVQFKRNIQEVEEFYMALRILVVSTHKHLQLTCIRIAKILAETREDEYLVRKGLVVPILQALALTEGKANLVNSTILALLEELGKNGSRVLKQHMKREKTYWANLDYAKEIFSRFSAFDCDNGVDVPLLNTVKLHLDDEAHRASPIRQNSLVGYTDDEDARASDGTDEEHEHEQQQVMEAASLSGAGVSAETVPILDGAEKEQETKAYVISPRSRIALGIARLRQLGEERQSAEEGGGDYAYDEEHRPVVANCDHGGASRESPRVNFGAGAELNSGSGSGLTSIATDDGGSVGIVGYWGARTQIARDRKHLAVARRRRLVFGSSIAEPPPVHSVAPCKIDEATDPLSASLLSSLPLSASLTSSSSTTTTTSTVTTISSSVSSSCASICDVDLSSSNELPSKRLKVEGIPEQTVMAQSR